MPTMADLGKIASTIYEGNPSINSGGYNGGLTYKAGTASSLGLPEPSFYLWSGEEGSAYEAHNMFFNPTSSGWCYSYFRYHSDRQAVCLGD